MRQALLALALAIVLLCGARAQGQRFAAPVDVGGPLPGAVFEAYEPALASSAGGVWLIAVRVGTAMRVVRSVDDGRSWEQAALLLDVGNDSAPALVQRDGAWVLAWSGYDGIFVLRSLDTGATWSAPLRVGDTVPYRGRPRLASAGDAVVLAWTYADDAGHTGLVSRSTDDGLSWALPQPLGFNPIALAASDAGFLLAGPGVAATSSDGAVWTRDTAFPASATERWVDATTLPSGAFLVAGVDAWDGGGASTLTLWQRGGIAGPWQPVGDPSDGRLGLFRMAGDGLGTVALLTNEDTTLNPRSPSSSFERRTVVHRLAPETGDAATTLLNVGQSYPPSPLLPVLGDIRRAPSGTWIVAAAVPRPSTALQLLVARADTTCGDDLRTAAEACDPSVDGPVCCSPTCIAAGAGLSCESAALCGSGTCAGGRCTDVASRCHDCDACNGAGECVARLRDDCTFPTPRSRLTLRLGACADGRCRDTLRFDWRGDVAGAPNAFGNPPRSGPHRLCTFVSRGGPARILFGTDLPARCGGRSCWNRRRRGFDFLGGAGPIQRVRLRARTPRHSRFALAASAADLFRAPAEPGDRVTVQLEAPNGACWAAQVPVPGDAAAN